MEITTGSKMFLLVEKTTAVDGSFTTYTLGVFVEMVQLQKMKHAFENPEAHLTVPVNVTYEIEEWYVG